MRLMRLERARAVPDIDAKRQPDSQNPSSSFYGEAARFDP